MTTQTTQTPRFAVYQDGDEITIDAETPEEAAREYLAHADAYCDLRATTWADVDTTDTDGYTDSVTIQLDPDEPMCDDDEHDWVTPHEIWPDEYAAGEHTTHRAGGHVTTSVCSHCHMARSLGSHQQRPDTGQGGFSTISYDRDFRSEL